MLPSASDSGPRRKFDGKFGGTNSVHAPVDWSNRASLPPFHSATQMLSNGSMHAPYGVAALVGIRCVAALRVAGSYMLIAPLNIQCTQILPCESTRPPISGPFRAVRITLSG